MRILLTKNNARSLLIRDVVKIKGRNFLDNCSDYEIAEYHSKLTGQFFRVPKGGVSNEQTRNRVAYKYFKKIFNRKSREIDKEFNETDRYKEYLLSKNWKIIRNDIIAERVCCKCCGSKENLQVHHKTYKNIFNELPTDLELLCASCHVKRHFG